ncbi:GGDEF domain-containing protein [Piscirickettsia salmonis]|uniref:GGDEF domain-containing protein n=1 Tax=Piscirickettsia salmonis TaxID=1238 RepID=UPI0007C8D603|nr:Diguanylate cyclase DosC [Piscirickettsiaceae bacterium NZ-RLO1]
MGQNIFTIIKPSLETQLLIYQTLYHQPNNQFNLADAFANFYQIIYQITPCAGVTYENQEDHIYLQQGTTGKYSYSVLLKHQNQPIGKLTFSHSLPFSLGSGLELDALCSLWLTPLFHILQYHSALQATRQDHLTQTGNRAAYEKILDQEINYAKRHDSPLSMLLIDIDHFKRINDQHGHQQGDLVLQHFSRLLKELVRDSDMIFRYGGEEFIVLLRNTDLAGANLLAKRVCESVYHTLTFKMDINVTVSIGSCEFDHYDTDQQFFQRADQALYHAKHQGRNCVASYSIFDTSPKLLSTLSEISQNIS